ncbi:MAG: hypothetical protein D8M59_15605 [Planctomycetes bacterium]|nr:hypothetical protein [Planctomycetota bacterium]
MIVNAIPVDRSLIGMRSEAVPYQCRSLVLARRLNRLHDSESQPVHTYGCEDHFGFHANTTTA